MTQIEALKRADELIDAIHKAFGAPGDYGYDTPQGDALFSLYRFRAELNAVIIAADEK